MKIESDQLKGKGIYDKLKTCPCYLCKHSTYKNSLIKCNLIGKTVPLDLNKCENIEIDPMITEEPHLVCKLCKYCVWKYNDAFGEYYPYCNKKVIYALGSRYHPQIGINCPCKDFKLEV